MLAALSYWDSGSDARAEPSGAGELECRARVFRVADSSQSRPQPLRTYITSTVRDAINTNHRIRQYIHRGFLEICPASEVAAGPLDTAVARILEFGPDLILAVGTLASDDADLLSLRHAADAARARLAFWLHDDPYEFDYGPKAERLAHVIFSNDSWAVPHYDHPIVRHLPLAGDRQTHYRTVTPAAERDLALSFCGVAYPNRVDILRSAQKALARVPVAVYGADWPDDLRFARNERLTPEEMAELAGRSLLTLNVGRALDIANRRYSLPASTPGPRTFETALSGCAQAFFVSGLEITDHFEAREEILLFDTAAELAALVEQAMDDPEHAIRVARNAQARALRDHTYEARARTILATLRDAS